MAINQNVPSCVAAGHQQRLPADSRLRQQQPVPVGGHVRLPRPARVASPSGRRRWGYYRASYTLSKAENNVGEFFFSGPIDPFDLSKDWGRSDNDRRHLFVFSGGVNTPMAPATTAWERAHPRVPVERACCRPTRRRRSTSPPGVTTVQGTAGRPIVDGEFIPRNSGVGDEFFTMSLRVSRTFRICAARCDRSAGRGVQPDQRRNEIARNTNFGTGAYPANPSPTYNQVTAVGDPRSWQLALRLRF